jgi:hypothetical protein
MCFSPEASFAVAGALVPIGGYCVRAAWRKDRRLLPLSFTPLLFVGQQAAEGVVWLALDRGDAAAVRSGSLAFLFFALALWPFWFPLLAAAGEARPARRRWLAGLAALASGWFWLLFYPLLTDPAALHTSVAHHSVRYELALPVDEYLPRNAVRVVYLLSMVVPMLAGPRVFGVAPGLVLAASAGVAAGVYAHAFASVWCFFAAVLSGWLAWFFWRLTPVHGGRLAGRA